MDIHNINQKMESKVERNNIKAIIGDLAYFGPIGETTQTLKERLGDDDAEFYIKHIDTLQCKNEELLSIIDSAFNRITELEDQ